MHVFLQILATKLGCREMLTRCHRCMRMSCSSSSCLVASFQASSSSAPASHSGPWQLSHQCTCHHTSPAWDLRRWHMYIKQKSMHAKQNSTTAYRYIMQVITTKVILGLIQLGPSTTICNVLAVLHASFTTWPTLLVD